MSDKLKYFHIAVNMETFRKFKMKIASRGLTAKSVFGDFISHYTADVELPKRRPVAGSGSSAGAPGDLDTRPGSAAPPAAEGPK